MKKTSLVKIAIIPMLFLAGCAGQQSTAIQSADTPTDAPAVPIPEVIQKDPLNWGEADSIEWSDDGAELAVKTKDQVNIYSTNDWSLIQTIPLEGISSYHPFAFKNGQIIGYFADDSPTIREYDPSSKQFTRTYPNVMEELLVTVNYEQMLYIYQTPSCIFTTRNICTAVFSLHHIKDDTHPFNFYLWSNETNANQPNFFFSEDGKFLVVNSNLNHLLVWNTQTETLIFSTNVDSRVFSVDFSMDGRLMVAAGNDGTARVWNLENGSEISRIDHFKDGLYFVQFLKDDQEIIIGTKGKDFSRWSFDEKSGKVEKKSDLFSQVETGMEWGKIAFPEIKLSKDEKFISIVSNSIARVWSLTDSPEEIRLPGYNQSKLLTAFSRTGELLAIADSNQIQVYNLRPTHLNATYPGIIDGAQIIHFVPNSNRLLIASYDQFYDWDYGTNQVISYEFMDDNPCKPEILAISGDATIYLTESLGELNICSTFSHKRIKEIQIGPEEYYSSFILSEEKPEILAFNSSSLVRWNLHTGERIFSISFPYITPPTNQSIINSSFSFFDDTEGMIKVMDLNDGSIKVEQELDGSLSSVIMSYNQRLLAAYAYGRIDLIDSKNGNLLFSKVIEPLDYVLFNPVLDEFYTISAGAIVPWGYSNLADPNLYDTFVTPTPEPLSIPCSSGEQPATESTDTPVTQTTEQAPAQDDITLGIPISAGVIAAENIQSLVVDQEIGKTNITYSTLSEDGSILGVADNKEITLYNVNKHSVLQTIPISSGDAIYSLSFNSDKSLLAFQLANQDIEIWNLVESRLVTSINQAHCFRPELLFSEDNKTLTAID